MAILLDKALSCFINFFEKNSRVSNQPIEHLINPDILFVTFKNFSYSELKAVSLVSKQWCERAKSQSLELEKIKPFISTLWTHSKPYLLTNQAVEGGFFHHKKTFFSKESFELNGKSYQKSEDDEWSKKENKNFFVTFQNDSLNLKEEQLSSQQFLIKLERHTILLSTQHAVQSDYAYLPVKWTFHSSDQVLDEEQRDLINKIKLEIECINKKLC